MYIYALYLWVHVCVLCVHVFCVLGIKRDIIFQKDSLIVDVLCPEANIIFGIKQSATFCAQTCRDDSVCASLFFDRTSKECYGAATTLSSTMGCSARPGVVYYKQVRGDYGEACSSQADCPSTYAECASGTCRCVAGAPYDPSTGFCSTSCVNYGLTYTMYEGMALSITSITTVEGITQQQCEQECFSLQGCRAFNYSPSLTKCRPMALTALDEPTSYRALSYVNHFVRNCA